VIKEQEVLLIIQEMYKNYYWVYVFFIIESNKIGDFGIKEILKNLKKLLYLNISKIK
jgi:hypothetical protein